MADKGQPASPEKAQKASPNRENPVIETLKTAIANSDGNSGDISSVEKAAQEYIAKDKTLEQYFKTHPEKLEEYKNELVRILKNYNGDVNQIRVYCEMALKNLDQSLKVTFREAANRIVDIARDHCVTLTSTNYAPTSFNDVKNTAQYFGHLYNEGSLGSQKQRYKEYLIGHPEEARKFIEFWSKDNAVKYLLSTQGEEGKKIIQGMDSFKESIKTANTKEAAKGLDIKGNTDSDQVAKIASLLRQSDGKAQIISAFWLSPSATEAFLNSFVGPGAKGLEELKKMPNGDKLVNGLKAAIEEGLRTKYNITTNNLDIEKISPKGTMELIARQSLFGKILRSPLTALSEENKIAYFMKFLPEAANSKEMNKFLLEQLGEWINNPDYQAQLYLFLRIFHKKHSKDDGIAKLGTIISTIEIQHTSKIDAIEMNAIIDSWDMSGWTKVKEIFARETNSVSVTAKLGVAVDTETEAYKQGFDKDKGKILANQIGKEGKVERVWQDAKLFGDSLANQTASDINFVTLRNYVAYLKASNQNVSEKLLNDFRNGGTNVKAIEKLEKLGQIVGVDVWTGNDVQTKDTNNDKGAIKQIYKESLQGAIKSVVSECVSKHAEDVFGILKRFIPSENQEKAVEMLKGLSTKTPDEQRRIIVEVIYTCITKEGLRATNVGEKSVRIQAIESIFENKSTQSAQATNEQVAKVIEKAPAEIKKEIKKDGGKVLPSESLTKYLGSLGIIVDSKGNCESATREQAEKIKIMLKDTKKPLSEKDRLFLEALIIRHTGELDTRVNKDTSRNAGYIGSAPVLEEALKKTDRVADASRKQTDANSAARNLENYIEKRRINPRNNREMEILSDDPVFKTLTKEVKRTNQVRKRATEDYPELDSFFSNTSLLNSSSVLSGQKWDAALGREWSKKSEPEKPSATPPQEKLPPLQGSQNITPRYFSSIERARTPVWKYPEGQSFPYGSSGWAVKNTGNGIEFEQGTTTVKFDTKEEFAGMQLFHLLEWSNLLCLLPHIKEMIGSSDVNGISLDSKVSQISKTGKTKERRWTRGSGAALNEGEQRKILAMIGNFFLGDEKDSKFDATGFTQVTGVNSRRGEVVQEFNTQVQTITKGKGIMSAIRNKGYLNDTTGELKNIADFQKEWKQKAEKFNKQITQSV